MLYIRSQRSRDKNWVELSKQKADPGIRKTYGIELPTLGKIFYVN
jgi:hypothetical protein